VTTDPRIAALAEALRSLAKEQHDPEHGPWRFDKGQDAIHDELLLRDAAAILAALPPDWCGHLPDTDEDWRRLRAIEEAARAFVEHVAVAATWRTPGIGCDSTCGEGVALRAALAAKLAEALDSIGTHDHETDDFVMRGDAPDVAAAILGERGVFLPDGLPYWATRAEATIATLRETLASERERITEEVEALAQQPRGHDKNLLETITKLKANNLRLRQTIEYLDLQHVKDEILTERQGDELARLRAALDDLAAILPADRWHLVRPTTTAALTPKEADHA
jgi:hypothetical protein